jgi:iron complex transport system substrate-binding protein
MNKKTAPVLLVILALLLALTSCVKESPAAADGVTVTDMAGRVVTVPGDPKSICVMDPYAAPIVVMLGYGDRMPTTINAVSRCLLLQAICPPLKNAVIVKSGGAINGETILQEKTDLIIIGEDIYSSTDERAKLDTLGIPYLVVGYTSMADQMKVVTLLGRALRNETMAQRYVDYYQNCIDTVTKGMASVPGSGTIKLYHAVNEATRTDDRGSLCADWIGLFGVVNVSLDTKLTVMEDKAYATLEQIYSWDPDIIIANESGVADYIKTDSKWQGLRAVIDDNVFQIPIGLSRWGHPTSIETPLAVMWLADLLYPEQFTFDIRAEMASFYETFYSYTLSSEEADDIISGYGVRTPKTVSSD